eukprot:TRINITY_DN24339_c0_g1_i1.p1 TRINITY_DN24339_c0_g1~~TRINITY_DN24339_c0_g1_i1.p1  ORF type:complete len:147 (+),score=30.75 TRINITY_DN24339_c0_g1_i1:73-513(+)
MCIRDSLNSELSEISKENKELNSRLTHTNEEHQKQLLKLISQDSAISANDCIAQVQDKMEALRSRISELEEQLAAKCELINTYQADKDALIKHNEEMKLRIGKERSKIRRDVKQQTILTFSDLEHNACMLDAVSYTHLTLPTICSV